MKTQFIWVISSSLLWFKIHSRGNKETIQNRQRDNKAHNYTAPIILLVLPFDFLMAVCFSSRRTTYRNDPLLPLLLTANEVLQQQLPNALNAFLSQIAVKAGKNFSWQSETVSAPFAASIYWRLWVWQFRSQGAVERPLLCWMPQKCTRK